MQQILDTWLLFLTSTQLCWAMLMTSWKAAVQRARMRARGSFEGSNLFSLLTKPLWSHREAAWRITSPVLPVLMAMGMMVGPNYDGSASLQTWSVDDPVEVLWDMSQLQPVVTEKSGFVLPVVTLHGISQGFHTSHQALDMRAPLHSKVVAIDDGVVTQVTRSPVGYGNYIMISHGKEVESLYAHLDDLTIEVGLEVEKGDTIGTVGMTGLTTGPHVHFEIIVEDLRINPLSMLKDAVEDYQTQSVATQR